MIKLERLKPQTRHFECKTRQRLRYANRKENYTAADPWRHVPPSVKPSRSVHRSIILTFSIYLLSSLPFSSFSLSKLTDACFTLRKFHFGDRGQKREYDQKVKASNMRGMWTIFTLTEESFVGMRKSNRNYRMGLQEPMNFFQVLESAV